MCVPPCSGYEALEDLPRIKSIFDSVLEMSRLSMLILDLGPPVGKAF